MVFNGFSSCHDAVPLTIALGDIQPAPGIQGVVHLKLPFEILQVVRVTKALANCDSLKSSCQWIGIQVVCVCGIDHFGHS